MRIKPCYVYKCPKAHLSQGELGTSLIPESILSNQTWRNILQSKNINDIHCGWCLFSSCTPYILVVQSWLSG